MKTVNFIKSNKDAIIPDYAHKGDAGMDLYSCEDTTIEPMEWKKVNTGLIMELPKGTEGQVRTKSGIAFNYGVFVLNTPGTVDENYRGEIHGMIYSDNDEDLEFKAGERLYSLYVFPVYHGELEVVDELSESNRGASWAGSSGK